MTSSDREKTRKGVVGHYSHDPPMEESMVQVAATTGPRQVLPEQGMLPERGVVKDPRVGRAVVHRRPHEPLIISTASRVRSAPTMVLRPSRT